MDYERRQVYRGPEDYVDLPADRKRARRAHRRSAAGLSPTTTSCGPRSSPRRRPKKVVAVLQNGEAVDDHRRRPEAGSLGACRPRRNPKTQIRPGAVVRLIARRQGRLGDHAAARGRRRLRRASIRAPARSAPWSAASTTRRASSTTSPRPGASRARASSPSSIRRRSKRASRRRPSSTTRRCSSTPAPPAASPGSRRTTTATSTGR